MNARFIPVQALAWAACLPSRRIENAELAPDEPESVEKQTGIKSRRYAQDHEAASDLAAICVRQLQKIQASVPLDLLCVATTSGDVPSPATAHFVHRLTKLPATVHCFDVASSCSSFLSALRVVSASTTPGIHSMVVAAELKHKALNPANKRVLPLFADGACGVLLSNNPSWSNLNGLSFPFIETASELVDKIGTPVGGSREPFDTNNLARAFLDVRDGKMMFVNTVRFFVHAIERMWEERTRFLIAHGLPVLTPGLIFLHQANGKIIREVRSRTSPEIALRIPLLMSDVGNMVCAALPVLRSRIKILEAALREFPDMASSKSMLSYGRRYGRLEACGFCTTAQMSGESISVVDQAATCPEDSWLADLDPNELELCREVLESSGVLHTKGPRVDILIAAGGGFQTVGCLHAYGFSEDE